MRPPILCRTGSSALLGSSLPQHHQSAMSPPRRHLWPFRSSRSAAILDAVRRTRHQRRHRLRKLHTAAEDSSELKASSPQTNGDQGGISQGADNMGQQDLFEKLPDDILHRIHSLLEVQDAACAACVSRAFVRSWRCYSKLILNDDALRLTHIEKDEERKKCFTDKVDKILKNHYNNGVKVETLYLIFHPFSNIKASYLDRWLRTTVKFGIKELILEMPLFMKKSYNFPCSVFSDERAANSIQFLQLGSCAFHPTSTLGCFRKLKILKFSGVHITEEGLEHLLSKSCSLEKLSIYASNGIISLKIPCTMQYLKFLHVQSCEMLRVVKIDAPNLSSFHYDGAFPEIFVTNGSQLIHVQLSYSYPSGLFFNVRATLPSIARNVESLILVGCNEHVNTPMLHSKLPHLKNLEIRLTLFSAPSYDIFSLVSFLDASPALESFVLRVKQDDFAHYPVVGDTDDCPRQKMDLWHNCLKQVTITGFCSAKSLVEFTVHILESTRSLERLTLDTTCGYDRRIKDPGTTGKCPTSKKIGRCWIMSKRAVEEAHRAVKTAGRCIAGRVRLAVQFEVLGPCSRCHTGNQ